MSVETFIRNIADYQYVEHSGTDPNSYIARNKRNDQFYLIREFPNLESPEKQSIFLDEVSILSQVHFESVVLMDSFGFPNHEDPANPQNAFIASELTGESLSEVLIKIQRNDRDPFNSTELAKIVYGIAAGMRYLHNKKITHRDLNPRNIWLSNQSAHPKIGNFQFSKHFNTGDLHRTIINTSVPYFSAPEILNNEEYNEKIDVYSFGMILIRLYHGSFEFQGQKIPDIIRLCNHIKSGKRYDIKKSIPDPICDIIKACWSQNPDERPSFETIFSTLDQLDFERYYPDFDLEDFSAYKKLINDSFVKESNDNKQATRAPDSQLRRRPKFVH